MTCKLILNDENLYIENYKKILDISDIKIVTFEYEILGDNLHIITMDKYLIHINGKINEIRRKKNEHI